VREVHARAFEAFTDIQLLFRRYAHVFSRLGLGG
jgi:hypothetical protein